MRVETFSLPMLHFSSAATVYGISRLARGRAAPGKLPGTGPQSQIEMYRATREFFAADLAEQYGLEA